MRLDDILKAAGKYKNRKRVGRGEGSGRGKTSGRGTKGAGARAGFKHRYGYEGGQNPLLARIPKRGFTNAIFRKEFQIVNLADLDKRFDAGARVDGAALKSAGLIRDADKPVKVLARGEVSKALTVAVNTFSAAAAEKIAKAGGTVERL
jgi:large subunit ribosomal protein L15